MSIEKELKAFIEQTLDRYEDANKREGGDHFVRDTWLEPYMRENLKDLYLQLKFICEKFSRDLIIERDFDLDRSMIVFRRSEILRKIMFEPWNKLDIIKENPSFVWQSWNKEIVIEEYIDIILSQLGSLFEHYYSNLQNNVTLNCTDLARSLGLNGIVNHINRANNLKQLYNTLRTVTNNCYGMETKSLFPDKFYEVRCAVFHMDYYYEKIQPTNFKIFLNSDKSIEIKFDELVELTKDIISKINIIKIVPHWFAIPDSKLPLK